MLEPLPPELGEAFSVGDARAIGVARRRMGAADLETLFRGARVQVPVGDDLDQDEWSRRRAAYLRRMRGYLPVLHPNGFFCGPSAAIAWDIPLPSWAWPVNALHIGIHRPRRAPRRPDVIGHQFTRGFIHLGVVDELPVTDPASTWASLGATLGLDALVAAADRVLRIPRHPGGFAPVLEAPLAKREELEELARRKGRPGAPLLRQSLDLARTGASSPPETQVRLILHRAGLPEPVLDYDVYADDGRFLGCSELAYPELKIAMEYESDGHLTRAQLQRDIDKYQDYAEAGWYPVRLTARHVYQHPSETVRRVREARIARQNPSIWR